MDQKQIVSGLRTMLFEEQINLRQEDLYDAAAEHYKKHTKAKRVWTYRNLPSSSIRKTRREVRKLLVFFNENRINVIPGSGKTATEGDLGCVFPYHTYLQNTF